MMKRVKIFKLIIFIFIAQAAGLVGAIATTPAISGWYVFLNKPFFTPPNWLFGPVWTLLYLLMGISAYLIHSLGFEKIKIKKALYLFAAQLILNTLWSFVFFGFKLPFLAYIVIIILWIFIVLTIKNFLKLSKLAGYLMIPYLIWVTYASFLNLAIFLLNRQ
jgi:tryptophan-rich sensory protein